MLWYLIARLHRSWSQLGLPLWGPIFLKPGRKAGTFDDGWRWRKLFAPYYMNYLPWKPKKFSNFPATTLRNESFVRPRSSLPQEWWHPNGPTAKHRHPAWCSRRLPSPWGCYRIGQLWYLFGLLEFVGVPGSIFRWLRLVQFQTNIWWFCHAWNPYIEDMLVQQKYSFSLNIPSLGRCCRWLPFILSSPSSTKHSKWKFPTCSKLVSFLPWKELDFPRNGRLKGHILRWLQRQTYMLDQSIY